MFSLRPASWLSRGFLRRQTSLLHALRQTVPGAARGCGLPRPIGRYLGPRWPASAASAASMVGKAGMAGKAGKAGKAGMAGMAGQCGPRKRPLALTRQAKRRPAVCFDRARVRVPSVARPVALRPISDGQVERVAEHLHVETCAVSSGVVHYRTAYGERGLRRKHEALWAGVAPSGGGCGWARTGRGRGRRAAL